MSDDLPYRIINQEIRASVVLAVDGNWQKPVWIQRQGYELIVDNPDNNLVRVMTWALRRNEPWVDAVQALHPTKGKLVPIEHLLGVLQALFPEHHEAVEAWLTGQAVWRLSGGDSPKPA